MAIAQFKILILSLHDTLSSFLQSTKQSLRLGGDIDNNGFFEDSCSANRLVPTTQSIKYPPDFIKKAQILLDKDMKEDYLDLLLHGYTPPKKQQQQWSEIVVSEIEKGNTTGSEYDRTISPFALQLVEKNYDFSKPELCSLFNAFIRLRLNLKTNTFKDKFLNNIETYFPLLIDSVEKDFKKISYRIPGLDFFYSTSAAKLIDKKVEMLRHNLLQLHYLWDFSKDKKNIDVEPLWNLAQKFETTLNRHYKEDMNKHDCYYSMRGFISSVEILKLKVLEKARAKSDNQKEISDMKHFLKTQQVESNLLNTTHELRLEAVKNTRGTSLPQHIQTIVDDISSVYKTVATTQNKQTEFEVKNIMDKTIPQLLAAYLAFPENYRSSFKNDKGESPEALLVVGLRHQLDILKNFERPILLEKSQTLEVLNQYSHNKKMAMGK